MERRMEKKTEKETFTYDLTEPISRRQESTTAWVFQT